MVSPFRYERIDQLRDLLGLHDRSVVSMTALSGTVETTLPGDMARSYTESGDVAYVFVGPRDKLRGERREHQDGAITYTFWLREAAE